VQRRYLWTAAGSAFIVTRSSWWARWRNFDDRWTSLCRRSPHCGHVYVLKKTACTHLTRKINNCEWHRASGMAPVWPMSHELFPPWKICSLQCGLSLRFFDHLLNRPASQVIRQLRIIRNNYVNLDWTISTHVHLCPHAARYSMNGASLAWRLRWLFTLHTLNFTSRWLADSSDFWASVGTKFPKMGDSRPRTPMNHRAKLEAISFIHGGEIRMGMRNEYWW